MIYKKKPKKESPAAEQLRILRGEEWDRAHKTEKKEKKYIRVSATKKKPAHLILNPTWKK